MVGEPQLVSLVECCVTTTKHVETYEQKFFQHVTATFKRPQRVESAIVPSHRSGRITLGSDGKTWIQRRRDDSILEHGDPIALIEKKAEALRTWLEEDQGISLPLGYVRSKVVLVNAKCEVDESLKKLPAVFHHEGVQYACSDDLGWMNSVMTWLAGDMLANRSFRTLYFSQFKNTQIERRIHKILLLLYSNLVVVFVRI